MAKTQLGVSRSQLAALKFAASASELLLTTSQPGVPAGASYLLRAFAIQLATKHPRCNIMLVQRNGTELYQRHLTGPDGIFAMVGEMQAHGFAKVSQEEISFGNGATLQWGACAREAEIAKLAELRPDVLLVDDAEDVPEAIFARMRDNVMASSHPARRIIAAGHPDGQGWVDRHWEVNGTSGRKVFKLDPADLNPELVVRATKKSYREWISRVHGGQWVWAPHTGQMVSAIDRWIHGDWEHLAIFVPSQHGKTTAGPRNAVPYILDELHPSDWCSIASYQSEIANSRSADARELYVRAGGELQPGRKKVKEWQTLAGGGCWAAGTQAGQTGRSATWSFIDDGDKDWADAVNATAQRKKRRWYRSTYRARETMFATEMRPQKICATNTRWDPEDLIGFAMRLGHEAGETWGILVLSALYDPRILDGYRKMYPNFEVIPDYRTTAGEPLWPERRSREDWQVVFTIRGSMIADCECQQNPKGAEKGGQFEADWFVPLERDPAFAGKEANEEIYEISCRAWDLAATEGAGDWTAGAKVGRTAEEGDIVVRHVVRARHAPVGVKQLIAATMLVDGPHVVIRLPIDPAAGGVAQTEEIVRYLRQVASWAGVPLPDIVTKRPRRAATASLSAKAARAHDFRSRAQPPGDGIAGGVKYVTETWGPSVSGMLPDFAARCEKHPELREVAKRARTLDGDWQTPWLQEFQGFTGDDGREDDQVDGTVDAYEEVYEPPPAMGGSILRVPGW